MRNKSDSKTIDDIINEIKSKSADGDYIYRGEREKYEKVSSALYREYTEAMNPEEFYPEGFNSIRAQIGILKVAKDHIGESPMGPLEDFIGLAKLNRERRDYTEEPMETDIKDKVMKVIGETIAEAADREILTELQHYGGTTNLIDFTTDYHVALYFACSGDYEETGRVILLEKNEEIEKMLIYPRNPRHRVIAQKSIFLQPPEGYIKKICKDNIVYIPAGLKQKMLEHLRKFYGISTESIYNDIHGYIRYRNIHRKAYVQSHLGHLVHDRADTAELPEEEKQAEYKKAVDYYTKAISLNPDFGGIYCNRGEARLHLQEWEDARKDFTIARNMGVDIVVSFHIDYKKGIKEFEKKTGIELPSDIAKMLEGDGNKKEQSSIERGKPKRRPPKCLRVTLEDGTMIEGESQRKTFIEAIEVAGMEQVHALGLGTEMHPLIERKNTRDLPGKDRFSDTSGFYSIYGAYPAKKKEVHLRTIAEKLGLQWNVEVIER